MRTNVAHIHAPRIEQIPWPRFFTRKTTSRTVCCFKPMERVKDKITCENCGWERAQRPRAICRCCGYERYMDC